MTDFGRAPVRTPADADDEITESCGDVFEDIGLGGAIQAARRRAARKAANRHAAICAVIGALLIGIATGLTFAEHVSSGLVAWLFLSGMLALVLANLVMMES